MQGSLGCAPVCMGGLSARSGPGVGVPHARGAGMGCDEGALASPRLNQLTSWARGLGVQGVGLWDQGTWSRGLRAGSCGRLLPLRLLDSASL